MAAIIKPFASEGVAGITTLSPERAKKSVDCLGMLRGLLSAAVDDPQNTTGTDALPPFM